MPLQPAMPSIAAATTVLTANLWIVLIWTTFFSDTFTDNPDLSDGQALRLLGEPQSGDFDGHVPVRLHAGHILRVVGVLACGRGGARPRFTPRAGLDAIRWYAFADQVGLHRVYALLRKDLVGGVGSHAVGGAARHHRSRIEAADLADERI